MSYVGVWSVGFKSKDTGRELTGEDSLLGEGGGVDTSCFKLLMVEVMEKSSISTLNNMYSATPIDTINSPSEYLFTIFSCWW